MIKGKKRYNNVRVVNPLSSYQCVKLHPNQGVKVVLDNPCRLINEASPDTEVDVLVNSEWLLIESIEEDQSGKKIYSFVQRYDLSDYDDCAVSLGSMSVIFSVSKKEVHRANVCFQLNTKIDKQVVCVNPLQDFVLMQPHQCVEVVISDPSFNLPDGDKDVWNFIIKKEEDSPVDLKLLQHEVSGSDSQRHWWDFKLNPFLAAFADVLVRADKYPRPYREHHYWFSLTEESMKKAHDLPNGMAQIATIDFVGNCKGVASVKKSVNLVMSVAGKNKRKIHHVPKAKVPETDWRRRNPTDRAEDNVLNILTNPAVHEVVYLTKDNTSLTMEMVQPSAIFESAAEADRWEMFIEDMKGGACCIKTSPSSELMRWGRIFQRTVVSTDYKEINGETCYIGAVVFRSSKFDDDKKNLSERRVAFWYSPVQKDNPLVRIPEKPEKKKCYEYSSIGKKYCGMPKTAILEITEVPSVKLTDGAKSFRIFSEEVSKKKRTTDGGGKKGKKASENGGLLGVDVTISRIVFNPSDGEIIRMEPGSEVIVKMSGKPSTKWFFQTVHDEYVDFSTRIIQPSVNDKEIFEIAAKVKNNLPSWPDEYYGGCVRLCDDNEELRSIRFMIDTTKKPAAQEKSIKIIKPSNKANNYQLVADFDNNDGVIISKKSVLCVRYPNFAPWTDKPTLKIVQYGLPDKIWNLLPENIKQKIDRRNPWLPKVSPLSIDSGMCVIRPLENQQPYLQDILIAHKYFDGGDIPVADIVFTSHKHIDSFSVCNNLGTIEYKPTISKVLHLTLKPDAEGYAVSQTVRDPKDQELITAKTGELLNIVLPPRYEQTANLQSFEAPWYLPGHKSEEVHFKCMEKDGQGWFVFRFECMKQNKSVEKIEFRSGKQTLNVFVNVNR